MYVLDAGFVDQYTPFDDNTVPRYNNSRIQASCAQLRHYKYTMHRVTSGPSTAAMQRGSFLHSFRERLMDTTWSASMAISVAHDMVPAILEAATQAEDDYCARSAKELRDLAEWLPLAAPHYVYTYPNGPVTGEVIHCERPIWVRTQHPNSGRVIEFFGIPDTLCNHEGWLVNGECKTFHARTDTGNFITHRSRHTQDAIIACWGHFMVENKPEEVGNMKRYYGTIYDLFRMSPYPQKAVGKQSKEDRIEAWPATLFSTASVGWAKNKVDEEMLRIYRTLLERNLPVPDGIYSRDLNQCMTYGTPTCDYFEVCFAGRDINGPYFESREPDYVDYPEAYNVVR